MKKVTMLCLSLLSANALFADVRLMMDVCVGDMCMKGEFVLDENNPIAELSDESANIVVQVQQVEAPEQDATIEDKQEVAEASAEVVPAPEFEVTIQNDGVTTTHMVQGQWGCAMQCNNEMVMVTMMARQ